jgi:hypothetical protein
LFGVAGPVANLIGYVSRKLGRYDDAKLAADPNHAVTGKGASDLRH